MFELLPRFPANVVAVAAKGNITRDDYKTVLEPAVDAALKKYDKVRLYYRIDSDFTGIQPSAMWEDFVVGMGHFLRWERIAVVTDVEWIRATAGAFRFLIPAELKLYTLSEAEKARDWIVEAEA